MKKIASLLIVASLSVFIVTNNKNKERTILANIEAFTQDNENYGESQYGEPGTHMEPQSRTRTVGQTSHTIYYGYANQYTSTYYTYQTETYTVNCCVPVTNQNVRCNLSAQTPNEC